MQKHASKFNVVAVNAGTSDPSSTRLLVDRIAGRTIALANESGHEVEVRVIDLRTLASDITTALTSNLVSPELQQALDLMRDADGVVASTPVYKAGPSGLFTEFFQALDLMRDADGVVASTPVYKAGPSGLFTEFFQILDNDLLIGTPVVLAGTGGSPRHSLVIDDQLRGMFAYLRTMTAPTAVYASPEDWQESSFGSRIDRGATELVLLMQADIRSKLRGDAWGHYQHTLGSAGGAETEINLDTDLMRLATGGR